MNSPRGVPVIFLSGLLSVPEKKSWLLAVHKIRIPLRRQFSCCLPGVQAHPTFMTGRYWAIYRGPLVLPVTLGLFWRGITKKKYKSSALILCLNYNCFVFVVTYRGLFTGIVWIFRKGFWMYWQRRTNKLTDHQFTKAHKRYSQDTDAQLQTWSRIK